MADALRDLPQAAHPDLLVGFNKADDAGVFRIAENLALVQTVDFFPPIVDDPYHFGQIAAANALSDVYAMGGKPLTALNIVGFPMATLPPWVLTETLRGGNEKITESGAVVVGGHSIKDKEFKYGVSVTGLIDPARIISNSGAKVGDCLFLTKPLGTGIITTGIKRGMVNQDVVNSIINQMASLNRTAAEIMLKYCTSAATDITGFGLLGHASEMAVGSNVSLRIYASKVSVRKEALELAAKGVLTGGAQDNREYLAGKITVSGTVKPELEDVLYDPQTSGGLLVAVNMADSEAMRQELILAGLTSDVIGVVEQRATASIIIEA